MMPDSLSRSDPKTHLTVICVDLNMVNSFWFVHSFITVMFILVGCKKPIITEKNFTPDQCYIIAIADSTISNRAKTVQFNFVCRENIIVKEFNFYDENPWKKINYPIFPDKNSSALQNKDRMKTGAIDFSLRYDEFEKIRSNLPLKLNDSLKDYYFTKASTVGVNESYSPHYALSYYNIRLSGTKDTISKPEAILFTSAQLKVFNTVGEMIYEVIADNYDISFAQIDTVSDLLFFRTTRMNSGNRIEGLEVHDLQKNKRLFKTETDLAGYIGTPVFMPGQYILFQIANVGNQVQEALLFDIKKRIVFKKDFDKDYNCYDPVLLDMYLLFYCEKGDGDYMYDTIWIDDFKEMQSIQ